MIIWLVNTNINTGLGSLSYLSYINLLVYSFISIFISIIIYILSFLLIKKNSYVEKLIPYECGFEPYEDTRNIFNVQFYLVALLFLIFDLESLYLYPLIFSLPLLNNFSMFVILDFFLELFLGYFIVYKFILKDILNQQIKDAN
jgi:NADH-quinone oxidoreductase subunit A|nr:NADH dehydrogenase subunit 3 [Actinophrys sol]